MNATFEIPFSTETLTDSEICSITGAQTPTNQIKWLSDNGWKYHISKGKKPIVGRMYARFKMAGVNIFNITHSTTEPDFSRLS